MIRQTVHYLKTGELLPPHTPRQKIDIAKLHLQRLVDLKGEAVAAREFRQHAHYYLKGIPRASQTKHAVNEATTQAAVVTLLDQLLEAVEERELARLKRTQQAD